MRRYGEDASSFRFSCSLLPQCKVHSGCDDRQSQVFKSVIILTANLEFSYVRGVYCLACTFDFPMMDIRIACWRLHLKYEVMQPACTHKTFHIGIN